MKSKLCTDLRKDTFSMNVGFPHDFPEVPLCPVCLNESLKGLLISPGILGRTGSNEHLKNTNIFENYFQKILQFHILDKIKIILPWKITNCVRF